LRRPRLTDSDIGHVAESPSVFGTALKKIDPKAAADAGIE
jgi:hypothetical protein